MVEFFDHGMDFDVGKAKETLFNLIRPEVRKMAMQMEMKFRMHDEERGDPFLCDDFLFMKQRVKDETKEMYDAVEQMKPPSEVWREAADRCNIITMEAVAYEKRWKKRGAP
jgi:hypothetical protein